MKKFLLFAIPLIISSHAYMLSAAPSCDETFHGTLRAGYAYTFWDDLKNTTGNPVFVNQIDTIFAPEYAYDANPTFTESSLVADSHIFAPSEIGRIVTSSTYLIGGHPPVRSSKNLVIDYDVTYSQQVDGVW